MIGKLKSKSPAVAGLSVFLVILLSACSQPTEDAAEVVQPVAQPVESAEAFLARARAVHHAALVLDAHADIEIAGSPSRYAGPDGVSRVAPEKMRTGGVNAVVMSVAVGPGPRTPEGYAAARQIADEKLAAVVTLAADPANNAVIPRTVDELEAAHADGGLSLILGLQNALILGTEVDSIDELYQSGVRVFALTHMGHNDFADSSRPLFLSETGTHEPTAEHGGLSALGVAAIERINMLGGVVDISQLSQQAALQVMDLSRAPVIASHSNVQALSSVSRNLSDEEIDRIGATGGVIHVAPFRGYLFNSADPALDANIRSARRDAGVKEDYLYPFELYWEIDDPAAQAEFLGAVSELIGPGSLDDMLDHLDYIAQRIGVDHVGIGTDFNHGSEIPGFSDASEALNVTIGLLRRGYSAQDVEKIWGGNFLRVWRKAEQLAAARP
ncbi:MAG: membrane dipeptidase [Pseudomonadales bacterium]|nr:membrane dipeptidase [Pseudomonadales bacterium]